MPSSPYRIARQEHLGEMLDHLKNLGRLTWEWDYEVKQGRLTGSAVYWVAEPPGQRRRKLDTKRAEELALRLCEEESIVWRPVPHPGGAQQREETLRKIEELKRGVRAAETRAAIRPHPIKPVLFDLVEYPGLQRCLHDEPSGDRSAQIFRAACRCVKLGLGNGQVKWFLAQYPPFIDKYGDRHDADRELDRVVAKARGEVSG